MAESAEELTTYIAQVVTPGFRNQLLNKGLARGLIWYEGRLPPEAPSFQRNLTEDLLDYAHAVLSLSLRLRSIDSESPILIEAFLKAGEAIEAAIHRGPNSPDRGFHRVSAAISFHLARYSARAYSILPNSANSENLTPTEVTLVMLLRRNLDEMHQSFASWLLDVDNEDDQIADRIRSDSDFNLDDASYVVLTSACMRGLALFDHALTSGDPESAARAVTQFKEAATAAKDLQLVSYWWTVTLTVHLIDELWRLSLHQQIPTKTKDEAWPTVSSRHSWLQFVDVVQNKDVRRMWFRSRQSAPVTWIKDRPGSGVKVIIEPSESEDADHLVLTPSYTLLGVLRQDLQRSHIYIVSVTVDEKTDGVSIEYFGPSSDLNEMP